MRQEGPFASINWDACTDDTLPPGHIKFLHGDDQASVFRLDTETETSELVATWKEKPPRLK